jgi:hypothetical protein
VKHNLHHNHVADLRKLNGQVISNECKPKETEDLPVRQLKIINELATSIYGQHTDLWSSTRGPPCGIMLPAVDFLKHTIFKEN